jgi:hypothetical protein
MRYATMTGAPEVYIESSFRGHKASPGTYSVTLSYGKNQSNAECKILPNPLYNLTAQEYADYHNFMSLMEETLNDMHRKVNSIYKTQNQLSDVLKELEGDKYAALKKTGNDLIQKMKVWDEEMVQRKAKAYDDVDNFENKFTANYLFLINHVESDIPRITKPSRDRNEELTKQWTNLQARAKEILEKDVHAFSRLLWDVGVGAVRAGK